MPEFVTIEADDPRISQPRRGGPGDGGSWNGDPDLDPRKVVLPNYSDAYSRVTVADASDDQLAEHLLSSLRTIENVGEQCTAPFEPNEDGLAPQSWHHQMEALDARGVRVGKSSAYRPDYSNVRAAERRVRAIRAEIARREAARKAEAGRKIAAERERHEHILATAADEAAQLADEIKAATPALEQVAALADAIGIAAAHVRLNDQIFALRSRVEDAAKALGVEPPELPPTPGVPEAARRLHDALQLVGMQAGKQGIG